MPAYATYGSGSFTGLLFPWGLGSFPSDITLYGIPAALPRTGTLTLNDTDLGTTITLTDAVLQDVSTIDGFTVYHLQDRRANLKGLSCNYEWNVPDAGGAVLSREKTPQDMASQLLDDMGETTYVVTAMPNDARPYIRGNGRLTRDVLDDLCDQLGCRIGLGLDNKIYVYRLGTGAALPSSSMQVNNTISYTLGNHPDNLGVAFSPTVYQTRLTLKAVELDTLAVNDSFIDTAANLNTPWAGFQQSLGASQDRLERSKYRFYRISNTSVEDMELPDGTAVPFIHQLELRDEKIDSMITPTTFGPAPPQVFGKFFAGNYCGVTHSGISRYPYPFRIHKEAQVVEFDRPVFRTSGGDTLACDELYLETSFTFRQTAGDLKRRVTSQAISGDVARQDELINDRMHARYIDTFDTDGSHLQTANNTAAIDVLANSLIDAVEPAKLQRTAQVRQYRNLQNYAPDGLNWQVVFASGDPSRCFGEGAPWTLFGRNCEPFGSETYAQRRERA